MSFYYFWILVFYYKKILVTGASSGLGKEMTKLFAARGAHVLMVSRSMDRLKATAKEIEEQLA